MSTGFIKILILVNAAVGVVLTSSATILEYFQKLGTGAYNVAGLVLGAFGVLQTLSSGLLAIWNVKAQAAVLSAHASARSAGMTDNEIAARLAA